MESRPPVVVLAVHVAPALDQQTDLLHCFGLIVLGSRFAHEHAHGVLVEAEHSPGL
jgi:hypothetical protein